MESIVLHCEEGRYRYTQVERQGHLAIYCQQHKASGIQRYELIRIRTHKEHTWPNGDVTPEKEAYPPSTAWGRDGFTFYTLAAAQAHLATMQHLGGADPEPAPASSGPESEGL